MISIVITTCQIVIFGTLFATFVGICCPTHLREQTLSSMAWILCPMIIAGLIWYLLRKLAAPGDWDLAGVNDLVQGSIEASVVELEDAYRHFAGMPQIEIVGVTE